MVFHVENGDVLDMKDHPNRTKCPNQKIMFLKMEHYVFMVPYGKEKQAILKNVLIGAAKATLSKGRRIDIRLTSGDLELIQKKAVKAGMPYQPIILSLTHKYVAEQVKDI